MQVPGPETRVVELRVHGILGTKPHDLTDSVASVDVAGDGVGRIVRPADRLLRPVGGPDLTAGERTVSRTVEGYVWGDMTSGGAKATWALLFPFALANVAHWMLPPTDSTHWIGRALGGTLRALFRLAALLLTMLFVAHLTVIGLDLLAAQCLRPGSQCLSAVPQGMRGAEWIRSVLAMLSVSGVIFAMYRLSTLTWRVCAPGSPESECSAESPTLPGRSVVTDPETPALRALHITAGLATMALLALGGPTAVSNDPRWIAATVLCLVCVVTTLLLDDPTGSSPPGRGRVRALLGRYPRRVLLTAGMLLVLVTAPAPLALSGPLRGSGPLTDLLTATLLLTCAAVGLLLVPAALAARPSWKRLPRRLRPWAGGWFAAPTLFIACLLGNGFGAGLALSLRQAMGASDELVLPASYDSVTLLWGTTTALLIAAGVVLVPWTWLRWWQSLRAPNSVSPEVELLHAGRPEDQRTAESAWKWADLQRHHSHRLVLILAGALACSVLLALSFRLAGRPSWEWTGWLVVLGVGSLATLAAVILRLVYLSVRRAPTGRRLGALCDLALFWPREAHPVVPPCYALKVIPELVDRANEHLSDPNTRVVLAGHSQGSLLAAVAASRLIRDLEDESARTRVGLLTAGSQLQWGYARAFPEVVAHEAQGALADTMDGRWRSLCRGTDPIGGAVTTWNRQVYDGNLLGVGFRADGGEGPLPTAARGPTGALVLGGDHWLPDPQRGPFGHRRWVAGLLRHAEYSGDPEWDRAVSMAAGLELPARGASLPLRTSRTLTPARAAQWIAATRPPVGTESDLGNGAGNTSNEAPKASDDGEHENGSGARARVAEAKPDRRDRETVSEAPVPRSDDGETDASPTNSAVEDAPEPPEIFEPPGVTPPWERGPALRPSTQ